MTTFSKYGLLIVICVILLIIVFFIESKFKPKPRDVINEIYIKNTKDSKDFVCPEPIKGYMGHPGVKGRRGERGVLGDTGIRGLRGPMGDSVIGPDGPQGITGPKGGQKLFLGNVEIPSINKISAVKLEDGYGEINIIDTSEEIIQKEQFESEINYEWFISPLNIKHNHFPYKYKVRMYIKYNTQTEQYIYNMFSPLSFYKPKQIFGYIPVDLMYGPDDPRYTYDIYKFLSKNSYNNLDLQTRKNIKPIFLSELNVYLIRAIRQNYGDGLSVINNYLGSLDLLVDKNQIYPYTKLDDIEELKNATKKDNGDFFITTLYTKLITNFKPIEIYKLPEGKYTEEYFISVVGKEYSYYLRPVTDIFMLIDKRYATILNNVGFESDDKNDKWVWCRFKLLYGPNISGILDNVYKLSDFPNDPKRDILGGVHTRRYYSSNLFLCNVSFMKSIDYSTFTYLYKEIFISVSENGDISKSVIYSDNNNQNIYVRTKLVPAYNGGYSLSFDKPESNGDKVIFNTFNNATITMYLDTFFIGNKDNNGKYEYKYLLAKCNFANGQPSSKNIYNNNNAFERRGFIKVYLDYHTYRIIVKTGDGYNFIETPFPPDPNNVINNSLKKYLNINTTITNTSLLEKIPECIHNFNQEYWFEILKVECSPIIFNNPVYRNELFCFGSDDSFTEYITDKYLIPANEPGGLTFENLQKQNTSILQYRFLRDIKIPVTNIQDEIQAKRYTIENGKVKNAFENFIDYKKNTDVLVLNNPEVSKAIEFGDETGFFTRDWYKFSLWYFETYLRQI